MSEINIRRLTVRAAELMGRRYDREFVSVLEDIVGFTQFPESTGYDDWRTFVDLDVRKAWGQLDKVTRIGIYITALRASYETTKLHNDLIAANERNRKG